MRLGLADAERVTLAEIAKRLGRKALKDIAQGAKPDTILAGCRRLIAQKFDGSRIVVIPGVRGSVRSRGPGRRSLFFARSQHSDDWERAAIQVDRACRHIGIASKFALPEWIAYDGPWHSAFWPVIGPRDGAAHHGSNAERSQKNPPLTQRPSA
jgi:hypothetical protein